MQVLCSLLCFLSPLLFFFLLWHSEAPLISAFPLLLLLPRATPTSSIHKEQRRSQNGFSFSASSTLLLLLLLCLLLITLFAGCSPRGCVFGQLNYYGQDNGSAEGRNKGKRGGPQLVQMGQQLGKLPKKKCNGICFHYSTDSINI